MNRLDRYIGARALRIFLLAAAALTGLFSLLDFVQQLALVGQGSYSARGAFFYTLFLTPSRLLQLAPVAMLLACLLALGGLARHAELTALRSLGVSEARIIGALLKLSLPIIFMLFLLAQYVVPTAQRMAQGAQEAALGESATPLHYGGFWVTHNGQYLDVQRFGFGSAPEDIDIYDFADDGSLIDYIHADSATVNSDGTWMLRGVQVKKTQGTQFVTTWLPTLAWASFVSPKHMQLLQLPPAAMPPIDLFRYIYEQKRDDQQTENDELVFWTMVGIPVSLLAMVLAAAPFAFGAGRLQTAGRQMLAGGLLGIGFELTQQLVFYFGLRLDLPPAAIALAPPCLLGAAAAYAMWRAHNTLLPSR